ncbi:MAG: hypothetical protein JSS44_04740 [Proteobacteria bacterium]|nr:hypothetical protein [Pseudomonadota bacterium]MBS0462999.1 hypothetical protein [Pseudomonadota bacterium]
MRQDAMFGAVQRAWWPVAMAAVLALAAVSFAAVLLAQGPLPSADATAPVQAIGWLRPTRDGQPVHWFVDTDGGRLERLPRDGSPVQVALLLADRPSGVGRTRLFLPAAAGVPEVFVNGASVPVDADVGAAYPAAPRMRPVSIGIPAAFFRPGLNRVDAVFGDPDGPVLMSPPLLGNETRMVAAARRSSAWIGPLRGIAVPLTLVAALLAVAAAAFSPQRGWFVGVSAAAAAAGCRLLLAGAGVPQWPATWHVPLDHALLAAALASLVCAVVNRPRLRGMGARIVAGALGALLCAAMTIAMYEAFEPFSGARMPQMEAFHGVCVIVLSAVLAWAAAWTFVSGAVHFARERLNLARTVRVQKFELERTARALEFQTRRAVMLEERQRLARDVHDGVGGTLASLLARIRMRRIDIGQIEDELVGGLADLRLIVDSMDAAGENLAAALAMFRVRIAPQVQQAGMALRWEQADDLGAAADDPQWLLHLYRLMQEAANNAMRHSGGTELRIVVRSLDARRLHIEISDDGVGLPTPPSKTGKGLANMAWRARRMGAQLRFDASAVGGTRVIVEAALPAVDAAQSRGAINPS